MSNPIVTIEMEGGGIIKLEKAYLPNRLPMKYLVKEAEMRSPEEEQRLNEMRQWTSSEICQYLCPNGTMTLEEFRQKLYNKVDEIILKKYGGEYIK
jgi:hypothetical protein